MNKKLRYLLFFPAFIYRMITGVRNFLFDMKILKSESFVLPVISVGNITVGGTGKTPFTEYLISELSRHFKIACLSRGYRRRSKGFIIARTDSSPEETDQKKISGNDRCLRHRQETRHKKTYGTSSSPRSHYTRRRIPTSLCKSG